ncbi:MAG: Type 1 glutamine amidotransferase-like domain-containing protein [Devosia sp.]|nr:Type 1 glutamine amidotransferase-like domain-containing protein [Devosia sp.]
MRLYLSSYRIGDRSGALLALLGNGKRAAVISNAKDAASPAAREICRSQVYDPHAEFASLGISAEDLDLRDYFGEADRLAEKLQDFDLVWAVGGNAFTLRRAMRQSGFDRIIVEMLDRDDIVYGGFSAGAVVAAPTLKGMELMDDPTERPAGYAPEIDWEGLGLVDFAIVPHYRSRHPETNAAEQAHKHFATHRVPCRTLRDGEVIVWTGPRAAAVVPLLQRIA